MLAQVDVAPKESAVLSPHLCGVFLFLCCPFLCPILMSRWDNGWMESSLPLDSSWSS